MLKQALQFPASAVAVRQIGTQPMADVPLGSLTNLGWYLGPDQQNMTQLINDTPSNPVNFLLIDGSGNELGIFTSHGFTGQTPPRF